MNKQRGLLTKTLVFGIILLLIGISVTPSIGISNNDDTTPPVTTHTLDPPEPNGNNGWYVSNVTVELTATDDLSGVKEIRISICGDPEIVIPGNYVHFFLDEDCNYYVDYWAIDNAGNVEPKNRLYINIDKTAPDVRLIYEVFYYYSYRELRFKFTAIATDDISGMERVEFFIDNEHQETIYGIGPEYSWIWKPNIYSRVQGFICKPEITEEYVKFFAIFVRVVLGSSFNFPDFYAYGFDKAGNMEFCVIYVWVIPGTDDFLLFQNITISNNYSGYIGKFFINVEIN